MIRQAEKLFLRCMQHAHNPFMLPSAVPKSFSTYLHADGLVWRQFAVPRTEGETVGAALVVTV